MSLPQTENINVRTARETHSIYSNSIPLSRHVRYKVNDFYQYDLY